MAHNEINALGKWLAGILLVGATTFAVWNIMAYWPDRMPSAAAGDKSAWYTMQRFDITLIEKDSTKAPADTVTENYNKVITDSVIRINKELIADINTLLNKKTKADSNTARPLQDSVEKNKAKLPSLLKKSPALLAAADSDCASGRIHLNTILMILVALMGFLGNLVHIATSFTTFVGNNEFKRSWILWYCVKPFTAAALALVVYIVIRAGFLNFDAGAGGVNLYGIMALSALAGLSTDRATEKLRDIFEATFTAKGQDNRKDKLNDDTAASVTPTTIPPTGLSPLTITGKQLNDPGIKVTMDGVAIIPTTTTADKMVIDYTPTTTAVAAKKVRLLVTDKNNTEVLKKDIIIK